MNNEVVTEEMIDAGLDAAYDHLLSFQSATPSEIRAAIKAAYVAMRGHEGQKERASPSRSS